MVRRNILAAAAVAVLVFASSAAFAEMADGIYTRHFMASEAPLWDISGNYSEPDDGLDFTLIEDPSGVLTGTGTYSQSDSDADLSGTMVVTGKVKSAGTVTRASINFVIIGTGTVFSDPVNFIATIKTNSDIDGAGGQLVLTSGRANFKIQVIATGRRGSASRKIEPGGTLDLPVDSTGEWDLTMDLVPFDSKKYDGLASTADVETSTGATADLTAKGSYSSKTDQSKIALKRTGGSLNLLVSTVPGLVVHSVKGKLYGQNVKFIAP